MRYLLVSMLAVMMLTHALHADLSWTTPTHTARISAGDKAVAHDYAFIVTGDREVRITKVNTSCGCTTAKLAKETYAPGESGTIHVEFAFGHRTGKQTKTITVETDDPEQPLHVLTLKVDIPQVATLDHRFLYWDMGDQPKRQTVTIQTADLGAVKVDKVQPDNEAVAVSVGEPQSDGTVKLTVTPATLEEHFLTTIRVEVSTDQGAKKTYFVRARSMPPSPATAPFRLHPRGVIWATGSEGQSQTIRIQKVMDSPLVISDAKPSNDAFRVTLETVEAGKVWDVVITPTSTATAARGTILLETAIPSSLEEVPEAYTAPNQPLELHAVVSDQAAK